MVLLCRTLFLQSWNPVGCCNSSPQLLSWTSEWKQWLAIAFSTQKADTSCESLLRIWGRGRGRLGLMPLPVLRCPFQISIIFTPGAVHIIIYWAPETLVFTSSAYIPWSVCDKTLLVVLVSWARALSLSYNVIGLCMFVPFFFSFFFIAVYSLWLSDGGSLFVDWQGRWCGSGYCSIM